jgi:hypothetical protein
MRVIRQVEEMHGQAMDMVVTGMIVEKVEAEK